MNRKFSFTVLFAVLASLAQADTIKLKSGEVIEGKITGVAPEAVTIEVQFSPTIIETRVVPKDTIESMDRKSPDQAAYAEIADTKLPTTIFDVSALNAVRKPFDEFIRKFPYSARLSEAKAFLASVDAENARLDAGDVKLNGEWIRASEYAAEKYQIDAAILASEMQAQLAASNPVGALNAFGDLRQKFPNSVAFVEALPSARQALTELDRRLEIEIRNLPSKLEARKQTLERTSQADRARVEKAFADEDARLKATADVARSGNRKFFAISSIDAAGLKQMKASTKDLRAALEKLNEPGMTAAVASVRQVQSALENGDLADAKSALASLEKSWSQYEGIGRLKAAVAEQEKASAAPAAPATPANPASTANGTLGI